MSNVAVEGIGPKGSYQSGSTVKGAAKDKCRFGQTRSSQVNQKRLTQHHNNDTPICISIIGCIYSICI